MPRKVSRLVTHETLFVTSWGNLDKTIPAPNKAVPGLLMSESEKGVEVSAPGKPSFVVPYAHVKHYELAPEAAAPKGKSGSA